MKVTVFEVGPRDGLQNESRPVTLDDKLWFAQALVGAGVREIELGAFVRAERVPQMADTEQVYAAVRSGALKLGKARAWALVPNVRGLERAVASGAKHVAVFTAATDLFARSNIGMSVAETLKLYKELIPQARRAGLGVRGYVSTAFGCPYEGKVSPAKAIRVVEKLLDMGVEQVSVGDTIGVATPAGVEKVFRPLLKSIGRRNAGRLAGHFHDTRGTALANALRALDLGITTLDASAGGLGGCPYAPGATGNLATEDLVYMLQGLGLKSGIDLEKLCLTSLEMARRTGITPVSRYLKAFAAAQRSRA